MVSALDAVRMGTMSINQVTTLLLNIHGLLEPARLECQTAGSGGQTKPQLKTSGNSRGFL